MPRIPDVSSYGARPTPQPAGGVPNIVGAGQGVLRGADIMSRDANQVGSDTASFAAEIGQAGERIAAEERVFGRRRDALELARVSTNIEQKVTDEILKRTTERDMTAPGELDKFREWMQGEFTQAATSYAGSRESSLVLSETLERIKARSFASMSAKVVDDQRSRLNNLLEGGLNELTGKVRVNPASLEEQRAAFRTFLGKYRAALTPAEEETVLTRAESALAEASLETMIYRGAYNRAEQIMLESPGLLKVLGDAAQKRLFDKVTAFRTEAMKPRDPRQGFIDTPRGLYDIRGGTPKLVEGTEAQQTRIMSPDEIKAVGLPEGTVAQRKADNSIQVIQKAGEDSPFGSGVRASSLQMFTELAPAFGEGQTTPLQDRQFIAAANDYVTPQTNPATGLVETRQLPSYVLDAFKRRGQPPPTATPSQGSTAQGDATSATTDPVFAGIPAQLFEGGKTIAEMGGLFTGPVSAAKEFIGRTPMVGMGAGEITSARKTIPLVFRRLVTAVQQNPRFAEAERASISRDLEVDPALWDNERAFMDRMVGIDRALEGYAADAVRALSGNISLERRKHELDTLQTITAFRAKLMPPRIETEKQYKEFIKVNPPGTRFLILDKENNWRSARVPQPKDE